MAHYKNDYTKEEDAMLWRLHEIRNAIAEENNTPEQINARARDVLAKFKLTNLKIIREPPRTLEKNAA